MSNIDDASVVSLALRVAKRTIAQWDNSEVEPSEIILAKAVIVLDTELRAVLSHIAASESLSEIKRLASSR